MKKSNQLSLQNTTRNDLAVVDQVNDSLAAWVELYFQFEVTTSDSSQKVQRRDLELFLAFMMRETKTDNRMNWTPRLSQAFKKALRKQLDEDGSRYYNDRTINRIIANLKTFAKWIHRHRPFPLDDPMRKIKSISTGTLLDVERAITPQERRRILNAADLLLKIGGQSKDRHRYRHAGERPRRKNYRPYRNRAIVYTLIETGMRRTAVTKINLPAV